MISELKRYINRCMDVFQESLIAVFASWFGFAILVLVVGFIWQTFLETPVGRIHIKLYPDRSLDISHVFNQNIVDLTWTVCFNSLVWGIIIAIVARFLFVGRFFSYGNAMVKTVVWIFPFIAFMGSKAKYVYGLDSWPVALVLVSLPSAVCLIYSMKMCEVIVPEISDAIRGGKWLFFRYKDRFMG